MLKYAVLTSGSCGNAYLFYDGSQSILIDMGLTLTGLKKRMENYEVPFSSLTDLFLTHMHPDHSKGAGVLHRAAGIPVHVSDVSYQYEKSVFDRLSLKKEDLSFFSFGESIECGSFSLIPFRTSHDSAGSAGYVIFHGPEKLFLMTDTGFFTEESVAASADSEVVFLESNYDEVMLDNGRYPAALKKRIKGERGHLSNEQAMCFIKASSLKGAHVYFVHLSAENNSSETVSALAAAVLPEGIEYTVCERGQGYVRVLHEEE